MEAGQARRPAYEGISGESPPVPTQEPTVHAGTATGHVSFGGVGTLTGTGKVIRNGPVEEQVRQLWRELDSVREDLGKLRIDTSARAKAIEGTVADLDLKTSERHQDLRRHPNTMIGPTTRTLNASTAPITRTLIHTGRSASQLAAVVSTIPKPISGKARALNSVCRSSASWRRLSPACALIGSMVLLQVR